ncbi:enoyl-CoA hydratase-related protein [Thermoactinomyces mirandus]|uniref:Enoyl-CoA hydratase/isomerase family protein n=1 Tax=Thermoactinomyces mirandus TaxID=2756294 RepID=A0A7W2AS19_9BACL|nr:enoyl-CoA hydratase-related protein [Thermoactinomyces mirandus]MBA4602225.1 enoyl-CoA hydratase/isomerase family protein [Thermoactinomyces mirandus]
MDEPAVKLAIKENVGIIRLNRPQVYNAMNNQMSRELIEALEETGKNPEVRAVILTGEGKAFCSGQDLNDRTVVQEQEEPLSLGESVRTRYNPMILAIAEMKKPVVAAVNGVAAGAGCSIALACDFRIITPGTRFIEAFARIGLTLDSGSSYFLPRLVGLGKALEIAMTGREVGAEEALQIGLANRIVEADRLQEEAFAFARNLAKGPTAALGLIRQSVYKGMESTLSEALENEANAQETAGKTRDFREGVQAFIEKRKPNFRGK